MLKLRCVAVHDARGLDEIFALRYDVFVEEMRRPQPDADFGIVGFNFRGPDRLPVQFKAT